MTTASEAPPATTPDGRRATRRAVASEMAGALVAAALALLAAVVVLQLWDAELHVPVGAIAGDTTDSLMAVKTVVGGHWFRNPQIGAPFGTDLEDYPFYWDLGQVLALKTFGLFSADFVAVFNAWFVLSFPLIAATTYLTLRWLGLRRRPAIVAGALFAVLPYHFLRGTGHYFIAQYWAVPLAGGLVIAALTGRPLFARRSGVGGLRAWATPRSLGAVALAIAAGVQFSYYAIFTILLLGFVVLVRVIAERRLRAAAPTAAVLVIVSAAFGAMLLPTLIYRAANGTNPAVANRQAAEAEMYGLKPAQLLLPIEGHRSARLAAKAAEYATTSPALGEGSSSPALGLVLSVAFLASLAALLVRAVGGRGPPLGLRMLEASGLLGLVCVLMGTVGGGSSLFAYFVSTQLRGWSRISVFVAFFAAVALAVMLGWALKRLERRRVRAGVAWVGLAAIVLFGIWDQTSPSYRLAYDDNLASWRSDGRFVRDIQRSEPPGSAVLQLPYVPFPESPPQARATDFDLFRGTLHSDSLRWTYGAVKGRATDWAARTAAEPPAAYLPAAAAAGFRGVYIDTYHYADGGAAVLRDVSAAAGGVAPARSPDGRLAYVSLDGLARAVSARCPASTRERGAAELVRPIDLRWGRGFYAPETDGATTWRWARRTATLVAVNPTGVPQETTLSGRVDTGSGQVTTVTFQVRGRTQRIAVPAARAARFRVPLMLAPGTTRIRVDTPAARTPGDSRDLRARIVDGRLGLPSEAVTECARP